MEFSVTLSAFFHRAREAVSSGMGTMSVHAGRCWTWVGDHTPAAIPAGWEKVRSVGASALEKTRPAFEASKSFVFNHKLGTGLGALLAVIATVVYKNWDAIQKMCSGNGSSKDPIHTKHTNQNLTGGSGPTTGKGYSHHHHDASGSSSSSSAFPTEDTL